ncbi:MAG: hypothetical protein ACJAQS_001293 [Porticoccus sp.]|jgi:hypothetical protein
MSKQNSTSIIMIVLGLVGLIFVYSAGSDGVFSRRIGSDITASDEPVTFFISLAIPMLLSFFSLFGGAYQLTTVKRVNSKATSLDDLNELMSKEIELSEEILKKMENSIDPDKTHNKSSKRDAVNRAPS